MTVDAGVEQRFWVQGDTYVKTVSHLPGATPVDRVGLTGIHIAPGSANTAFPAVVDAMLALVRELGAA